MSTVADPGGMTVQVEPLAVRAGDAAKMIGVSRSRLYEYLADGRIESFRVDGGIRLIPVEALRAWVERQRLAARAA